MQWEEHEREQAAERQQRGVSSDSTREGQKRSGENAGKGFKQVQVTDTRRPRRSRQRDELKNPTREEFERVQAAA